MLLITLLFSALFSFSSYAVRTPKAAISDTPFNASVTAKPLKSFMGKKPGRLQRLRWKLLQNKLVLKILKLGDEPMTERQRKQAKWSLTLGIASLALLFIPAIGILAIPAGVLAIIFGAKSLKGNSNSKGIIGIVLGGLTVLLFLIAIALLAAFLAGGGWY